MIFISHRGNIYGKDEKLENNPKQIEFVLKNGFDCEIDVWFVNNKFLLGHDLPQYEIDINFLKHQSLWCHAKDILTLNELIKNKIHCFFIENDKATITSKKYIWLSSLNKKIFDNTICVMPEEKTWDKYNINDLKKCKGICSDNIEYFKNNLK